ncbi:MAG TPA: hypothetical protein VF837_02150 [Patescibacteria group bacterium]
MKNQRRKIIAIILLVLILILGGASVFVATRISTAKPVAPTAPASQPKAGVQCTAPSTCTAGSTCPTGYTLVSGAENCATGQVCCTPPAAAAGNWVGSAACTITAAIGQPACTPRPGCLDATPACKPATPAAGYCPFLSCPNGKTIYKNVADNTAGTYNMDAANQLTGSGIVLNPGQMYVYAVSYTTDKPGVTGTDNNNGINSATITDTLDSRLTFVDSTKKADGTPACTATGGVVTCSLDKNAVANNGVVAFRVKVSDTAATGSLVNTAAINSVSTGTSVVQCLNTGSVATAPTVSLACKTASALNQDGTTLINTLNKNQTFQYSFDLVNNGNSVANNVTLTDVLAADKLIFVSGTGCTYNDANKTVTCTTNLNAGETKKVTFTVKTSGTLVDQETIANTATVNLSTAPAGSTGSQCEKDLVVATSNVSAVKNAYRDNTNNQAGVYQLTDAIDSVSKSQIFVYSIELQNTGTGTASGVAIADPLTGQGQDQLTLIDRDPRCEYSTTEKLINCHMDLQPGANDRIAFRVQVSSSVANGDAIKNIGKVVAPGQELTVEKDLTVSTVLGCNNTCTADTECTSGFVCDPTSKKCRNTSCLSAESCVCPATVTQAPPRVVVITQAPAPVTTAAPVAQATQAPQALPSTGILDIPGVAAFGGGLVMAIVGLLLAL